MLKKTKFRNTLFKTIIHFGETKTVTFKLYHLNKSKCTRTDIEQRKELKQNHINKEPHFTTERLNNACNWTLLSCAIDNMVATY
jgi:hypothetical protein